MVTLQLTIQKATGLRPRGPLKNDPYVCVSIARTTRKTKVDKNGGSNPKWNESIRFNCELHDTVNIEIKDKETFKDDGTLGKTSVNVGSFQYQPEQKLSVSMGGSLYVQGRIEGLEPSAQHYGQPPGYNQQQPPPQYGHPPPQYQQPPPQYGAYPPPYQQAPPPGPPPSYGQPDPYYPPPPQDPYAYNSGPYGGPPPPGYGQSAPGPDRSSARSDPNSRADFAFDRFDVDRSGYVDFNEFVQVLQYLQSTMSTDDAMAVFASIDENFDGKISKSEFCNFWVSNNLG